MTIAAYQGLPGSFGAEACARFLPRYRAEPQPSFADVAIAVRDGRAERGILPFSNTIAGIVPGVGKLVEDHGLLVLASHPLNIRMHLLGLPGMAVEQIRTVRSHPMALKQCARALVRRGLAAEPASNTAVAAADLAASGDPAIGVIASEHAARLYGLDILARDVHDAPDNATLFIIVAQPD